MRRPEFIARQSRHPKGVLGWVIARIMEAETTSENDVTVNCLDLQPTDGVLEVGFGAGRALERVAGVVVRGRVAGVDVSDEMLRMATRRCARFIRAGRMDLRVGAAERLPFEAASFDKLYSVHTIYFWERPADVVGELRRVLKSKGLLVLCFRGHGEDGTDDFPAAVYRFYAPVDVVALLRDGGFDDISVEAVTSRGLFVVSAHAP